MTYVRNFKSASDEDWSLLGHYSMLNGKYLCHLRLHNSKWMCRFYVTFT